MGMVSAIVSSPSLFFVTVPSKDVRLVSLLSLLLHSAYKVSLSLAYDRGELCRAIRGCDLVRLFATREYRVLFATVIGSDTSPVEG